jgi:dipeptidyl-peptidase-3
VILQASAQPTTTTTQLDGNGFEATIRVECGDHAEEMSEICSALTEASKYVSNDNQAAIISAYIESFRTGSLKAYRKSQQKWVKDILPRAEHILGFVEPYRDPYGVRAEFEATVCISVPDETVKVKALVEGSTRYIRMLP